MIKILTKSQFENQAFRYWAKTGNKYDYKKYKNFVLKKFQEEQEDGDDKPKKYIWKTMGDERVRDSHQSLDGKIFDWNKGSRPGEGFGCRCVAVFVDEDDYPSGDVRGMKYNEEKKDLEEVIFSQFLISSPFGVLRANGKMHSGIDFRMPEGSFIKAVQGGIVEKAGWEDIDKPHKGYGIYVRIKYDDGTRGDYGHMSKLPLVKYGDKVQKGQEIGYVGNTGSSTGFHLHYTKMNNDSNWTKIKPPKEEVASILGDFARQKFDN